MYTPHTCTTYICNSYARIHLFQTRIRLQPASAPSNAVYSCLRTGTRTVNLYSQCSFIP